MDLKHAAEYLGVHYQTAYRWLRDGSLLAYKVNTSYQVDEEELKRFLSQRSRPTPPPLSAHVRDWGVYEAKLFSLLQSGDELTARHLIQRLTDRRVPVLDLCEKLITPVLATIGDLWARGQLSVAEEHRASCICERLVANLMVSPRGRPRGVAVIGTPLGDQHNLPAQLATAVLRNLRWKVHHLGTQVPQHDFLKLAHDVHAQLVIVTVTNPEAMTIGRQIADQAVREGYRSLIGHPGQSLSMLVETINAFPEHDDISKAQPTQPH